MSLDDAQRPAVRRPPGDALLVLGEAGHGKTTVALHRLAHLWRSAREPLRVAAVVPTDGLARLLQPLLRRLGVDVEVQTYDRWASARARRAFRRLPPESDLTPPGVMSVKRHPSLRRALEVLAAREPGVVDDDPDAPLRRWAANAGRGDLQHLFGDRVLLERMARDGHIASRAVLDTLDRTRIQFSLTAEQEWAHVVDRERLFAVDRRAIDEGTASGCANTVDVEDYAVLFELDAMRAARAGRVPALRRTYDILMIDEAQELAPLELALLGGSLRREGTLIVAGDAQQQTDETSTFLGWSEAMRELGRPDHETVTLEIGYRCAPEIVSLARRIRRPSAETEETAATTEPRTSASAGEAEPSAIGGAPNARETPVNVFEDERRLAEWLALGLRSLRRHDPRASVAVLCRSPLPARRIGSMLQQRECPARIVFDGRFLPRGVQVTTVSEAKGLEFDFVVVPDASASAYPADDAARRALYVAVTRARHQVALACAGEQSPVLP